ncbi:MAG: hypothetical protein PF693_19290 [Spirochaetia bacterium]|jgi:hypothetical protein|nr:hypothetical protein [Spirochaetia bacterium]
MVPPDRVFSNLLHAGKHADMQNILMRVSDRELAICMLYLSDQDEIFLLSFLPPVKQNRIKQEQGYLERLNIRYPQYRTVIDDVILRLQGISGGGIRSYVRPRRE